MAKNWIIRTVEIKDVPIQATLKKQYLLLLCSEYDTYNYRYEYISKVPHELHKIVALAIVEGSDYIYEWYNALAPDDKINFFNTNNAATFKDIKEFIEEEIDALEINDDADVDTIQ